MSDDQAKPVGDPPPPDPKHLIPCTLCGAKVDKGCPPHPSDRMHFVCVACQDKRDAAALAKAAPTLAVDGRELDTITADEVGEVPAEVLKP